MNKKTLNDRSAQAVQHAQQYWYTDGIAELVMGGFFVLMGAYFGAQALLPQDSFVGSMLGPALLLIVVGGLLLGRRLIGKLKERLTYPRTGYVAFKQPSWNRRRVTTLVALGMGMLISVLIASTPASQRWIPAFSGLLIGVFWLIYAHRLGLARLYALAAVSAVCGVAITLAGFSEQIGLPLYYLILGLISLVSGGWTLWSYLHRTSGTEEKKA